MFVSIQRAFMVILTKSLKHPFHFRCVAVNLAKPPGKWCGFNFFNQINTFNWIAPNLEMCHRRGLRRVPSLEDNDQLIDNIEDIVSYLEVGLSIIRLLFGISETHLLNAWNRKNSQTISWTTTIQQPIWWWKMCFPVFVFTSNKCQRIHRN